MAGPPTRKAAHPASRAQTSRMESVTRASVFIMRRLAGRCVCSRDEAIGRHRLWVGAFRLAHLVQYRQAAAWRRPRLLAALPTSFLQAARRHMLGEPLLCCTAPV